MSRSGFQTVARKQTSASASDKQGRIPVTKVAKQLKKKDLKDKRERLKQVQEDQNKRTRLLVDKRIGDNRDEGGDESSSESQGSLDGDYSAISKKRKLQESQAAKENDITAFKKLKIANVQSDRSHIVVEPTPSTSTADDNEVEDRSIEEVLPSQVNERTDSHMNQKEINQSGRNSRKSSSEKNDGVRHVLQYAHGHGQLFGENCGDQMYDIGNGILCKTYIVKDAQNAGNPGNCCGILLPGVFTPEAVLNCSLDGKNHSASDCNSDSGVREPKVLYGPAVQAILKYSQKQSKRRGWPEMTVQELRRAMSKKIVRIRTDYKSAIRKNRK